jgi:hypothetical protein
MRSLAWVLAGPLLLSVATLAQNQPQNPAQSQAQNPPPQPPPQPAPAPTPQPAPTNPPAPPKPVVRVPPDQKIENMWSASAYYWKATGPPMLRGGIPSIDSGAQFLDLSGAPHRPFGIEVTAPMGKYDRLELSGFQTTGTGNTTAVRNLNIYQQPFPSADLLFTYYKTRNIKLSWNYLTYPAPPDSKFRFKTLWEVQYVTAEPTIDAFYDPNLPEAKGTRSKLFPTIGVGVEYVPSARFRLEARGSGFFIPHHGEIADTSGSAVYRIGHVEIFLGGKLYHYKTSQQNQDYVVQNLWGPYGGLRWVLKTK